MQTERKMDKFSQEIEVSGHLIDSLILTKIFDKIMDMKGEIGHGRQR